MSNKIAGVDVLLYVNVGTDASPNYVVLGGQGDATLNRGADEIDVSSKTDPAGYGDTIIGRKNWSIECEGFIVDSDQALDHLETLFEDRQPVQVELRLPSGKKYSGAGYITDFPLEFPNDDGATYSLTISGSGALTITN
ncbi:phage tail protein [Thermoactinomyces daqus]|uniref:Phage tail protein n=1 Tax=Thermoactinomyces daqus TaxID=1329516 RepID=A0A7W1XAB9_9BACL|nr:phage tail protein [Thermoactinomyces daqus]MBA4542888.1 phage tail protein [Thermoactinomyces daqus]